MLVTLLPTWGLSTCYHLFMDPASLHSVCTDMGCQVSSSSDSMQQSDRGSLICLIAKRWQRGPMMSTDKHKDNALRK